MWTDKEKKEYLDKINEIRDKLFDIAVEISNMHRQELDELDVLITTVTRLIYNARDILLVIAQHIFYTLDTDKLREQRGERG